MDIKKIAVFAVVLLVLLAVVSLVFHLLASLASGAFNLVLGAIVGGLLITIIILNRGFDNKPVTTDTLDFTLPYEERVKRAEKINKNKKTAKMLMNVFIPLAFVFCIDLLDLNFDIFDKIKGLFG